MKLIDNLFLDEERALYNLSNHEVRNCFFMGPRDGESALKEANNIYINSCHFYLRYPLWHTNTLLINNSFFSLTSRAAIWYSEDINIYSSSFYSVKALRECEDIYINNTFINSEEFCWKSKDIDIIDSEINGVYAFFECSNIEMINCKFKGKYSFQYIKNSVFKNVIFDTKDAFWHADNVRCEECIIKGEYLGWYSNNLVLINCKIIGTQPLCYCKNLKLINCEMVNCDLSFEYSEVEASIVGNVTSIKNPKSGNITVDSVDDIILESSVYKNNCSIVIKK